MLRVRRKVLQQLLPGPRKAEGCFSPSAFPSSQRGAAPQRKCREATKAAQTGWSNRHSLDFAELLLRLRASLEAARYRACASLGLALRATPARQLLLSCRASPPL